MLTGEHGSGRQPLPWGYRLRSGRSPARGWLGVPPGQQTPPLLMYTCAEEQGDRGAAGKSLMTEIQMGVMLPPRSRGFETVFLKDAQDPEGRRWQTRSDPAHLRDEGWQCLQNGSLTPSTTHCMNTSYKTPAAANAK